MSEETPTPESQRETAQREISPREMVKVIPDKPATPKAIPPKAEAKGGAAGAPKKPVKKVAKSWPYVNALLTTLSLTATLGGWAHFTLVEARLNEQAAVSEVASQAVVAAVPPTVIAPTPTYVLDLPPIPTVVPPQTFTINTATTVDTAAVAAPVAPAAAAPIPTAVAPAAPVLRSVSAPPPPVVSAPAAVQAAPAPAAPAPVAATGTSRR